MLQMFLWAEVLSKLLQKPGSNPLLISRYDSSEVLLEMDVQYSHFSGAA